MALALVLERPGLFRDGLVIGTHSPPPLPDVLRWHQADHPVPGTASLDAGRAALAQAASVPPDGTLVVLVSGGASSLMAVPAADLGLHDKQVVTRELLRSGADIRALNTVRKHLSAVKGGRLAAACRGRTIAWLLSDVVGDDPSVIGSGPTVPDPSTYAEALDVLDCYGGRGQYPPAVVAHLERGAAGDEDETPKPGAASLARAETSVIGSARLSLEGAADAARGLGYSVLVRPEPVVGEARLAAAEHLAWVEGILQRTPGRLCLLSCGETTVTVQGRGKGGRNQEFALAVAAGLGGGGRPLAIASLGTDGVDGPTDAAGAIVDRLTMARAEAAGLSAARALKENDSWTFFAALGDVIRTGPTDTNVGDIQVVLADDWSEPSRTGGTNER
jgi:glycerate 2-kinase